VIIEALYRHYNTLRRRPNTDVPPPGFAVVPVAWAFNLSADGELLDVVPLGRQKGKRLAPVEMKVPEPAKRTSTAVIPCFLCDNSKYIIGDDNKGKPELSRKAFAASRALHLQILQDVDDAGAQVVCRFFAQWDPERAREHPALRPVLEDVLAGRNIVFRLDGAEGFIHDRPKVQEAWLRYRNSQSAEVVAQCLVTGEEAPIARIHPSIKGVAGAQPSGAALSSYNLDAFESYGKTQNYNAPVSEAVAFGYTTALNYMLSNPRQRLQLDPNTTVVFWSERPDGEREETLIAQLLDMPGGETNASEKAGRAADPETTQLVHDVLARIRRGQPIDFEAIQVDPESRFFILGLSPNASRLSVRFWHADTFGRLVERIAQHHADMAIVAPPRWQDGYISVRAILRETAPQRDWEHVPPLLGGGLMRAILNGQPYPQALYNAMLTRIRADAKERVNYVRAAAIKAALLRRLRSGWRFRSCPEIDGKEVTLTVGLDLSNKAPAYLLGRLFAVLEKVQEDANPGINATIRDRYFSAASATPRAVFPQLLRLAQHHIAKAQYGQVSDRLIESILADLSDFPTHLDLGEQGLFMLGYYHQRQAFYEKSSDKE